MEAGEIGIPVPVLRLADSPFRRSSLASRKRYTGLLADDPDLFRFVVPHVRQNERFIAGTSDLLAHIAVEQSDAARVTKCDDASVYEPNTEIP